MLGRAGVSVRPADAADEILKLLQNDAEPPKEEEEDMLAVFSAGRG
jgi:hypothetical protein